MNAFINFFDDQTIYAILQALSPLCEDIKKKIIRCLIISIYESNWTFLWIYTTKIIIGGMIKNSNNCHMCRMEDFPPWTPGGPGGQGNRGKVKVTGRLSQSRGSLYGSSSSSVNAPGIRPVIRLGGRSLINSPIS